MQQGMTLLTLVMAISVWTPPWSPGFYLLSCLVLALGWRFGLHQDRGRQKPLSDIFCRFWFPFLLLSMVFYATWRVSVEIDHRLPVNLDGLDVELTGRIIECDSFGRSERFLVRVLDVRAPQQSPEVQQQLQGLRQLELAWYPPPGKPATPICHSDFRGNVRLRTIRAFENQIPFDYEVWMLRRGIDGRGYIRQFLEITATASGQSPLARWRNHLIKTGDQQLPAAAWRWLGGLGLGLQTAFESRHWQLAQLTGTLHLLVVSGLHLGMLAGITGVLLAILLRTLIWIRPFHSGRAHPLWRTIQALALIMVTGLYLLLAGHGVALQRAWLMMLVVLLIWNSGWRLDRLLPWLVAALIILLIDPLMITAAGFHYSMLAVLMLLAFMSGRRSHGWQTLIVPQWLVFIGLLPVAMWWAQPISAVQLLANLVAIPIVGFILLPLVLLILIWPQPWLVDTLVLVDSLWWQGLQWLADLNWTPLVWLPPRVIALWCIWLLLLYLGIRPLLAWGSGLIILIAIWLLPFDEPDQLVLMDVGQGLALMASSEGKGLLYDTGPRYSDRLDAGSAIVIPWLRKSGVRLLDLVVSHSDSDHAGGTQAVLAAGLVHDLYLGQPLPDSGSVSSQSCHQQAGQAAPSREWRIISPALKWRLLPLDQWQGMSDNDTSCIVMVDWHNVRILLTGDISLAREATLVARFGPQLQADILIASHHGSKNGTSDALLAVVVPSEVWFSSGFNNRFGHPHPDVLGRLRRHGIRWRNTAESGALVMDDSGNIKGLREQWHPPWQQP